MNGDVVSVAGGRSHTLVLESGGRLWVTGDTSQGQLGLASPTRITVIE